MLIYDNEYETKENKNLTKDKIKLQHTIIIHYTKHKTDSNTIIIVIELAKKDNYIRAAVCVYMLIVNLIKLNV